MIVLIAKMSLTRGVSGYSSLLVCVCMTLCVCAEFQLAHLGLIASHL